MPFIAMMDCDLPHETRAAAAGHDSTRDAVFRAVIEKVNAGHYLEEIADHVYESFRGLIPYDRIGLALLERDERILRARWARAEYPSTGIRVGFSASMDGSSLERVLTTRQPRIINDLEAHFRTRRSSEATARMLSEGIRSSLTCPLVSAGSAVGFLFFSSRQPGVYAADHTQVFREIASTLSIAVGRAQTLERLEQLNAELAAKNRELTRANVRIRRLTVTDPLTRVLNRRGLMASLRMAASYSDRRSVPLSIVCFDVDHFKRVNDTFGHDAGDRVLRHVAKVATACCRKEDLVARAGGEEFVVVLPGTREDQALVVAERLRGRLASTAAPGCGISVTASFGVAQRAPGEPSEDLIHRADSALYEAKRAGRNCIVTSSPAVDLACRERGATDRPLQPDRSASCAEALEARAAPAARAKPTRHDARDRSTSS